MDKLTAIKIKYDDGSYSDEIPISALAQNIDWDSTHTLVDILGSVNINIAGNIQDQINQLFNEKATMTDVANYIGDGIGSIVTDWLDTNVTPTGSAIMVDSSLTISGAAADAAATKDYVDGKTTQLTIDVEQNTTQVAENTSDISSLKSRMDNLQLASENYVDDGYVEDGVAYFTHNGTVLFEITGIGGGSGGGSGDTVNATLTVSNTSGWLSKTISSDNSCPISFTWSSIEDGMSTGNGTVRITNNGAFKASQEIVQGSVIIDLKQYLSTGSNIVKVQISDIYGQSRTINFSITVVALTISSSFDASTPFTGAILFPYTPVGAVAKTIHFILDNIEIATNETSISGRQLTQSIPAQSHGTHKLRVYFTSEINGETVNSNELYYEFISIEESNKTVIIASPYNETVVSQYSSIVIPYTVYDPSSLSAEVKIYANDTLLSTQTVDRSQQSYTYRANNYGTLIIKLVCKTTEKTISLTVTESEVDVEAETESLALYLTSQGRSNNEESPEIWEDTTHNISATLSNFSFSNDGWQSDDDGITVLRVTGDARVTIPYQPFASDFRTTGKTIELEFATRNVLDYDATILSCMSGGRGISVTAQKALLKSEQSEISTQYKEDEHVRIAFVAEKRAENRLLLIYINGIASGVVQYPTDDDFSQTSPVDITIGSSSCTIDIYNIRVYDNDLTRFQILDNWIADTQDGSLMLERFTRNNVFDAYGNIVISQLPSDLPYMIRTAEELPQYKGDKKTISISYVNPMYPSKSFTAEGVQSDVQGTSSQYYPRKNYKDKYKNGFTSTSGTTSTYAMNANAIPTNIFTMKADVASSEGANNVELARLYNDACPYKTPAQQANSKVRQGIDGFPIVMFWNDGESTTFLGKYNFNNDKGTPEVFGFADPDESWEIKNNTGNRVLFKSDDYSNADWLNDFEARYPDTDPAYTDSTQLAEFASWAKSTDREQATGNALDSSVTYDGVTYTTDTADYRLAKFKAEAGNYMEMQSALFYYLFTELFLMVDSRAKNAFPSFIGSEVN